MEVITYRGHALTPFEQPAGGFRIEIAPVGSDRSVFTSTHASLQDAMASARHYVDLQHRTLN